MSKFHILFGILVVVVCGVLFMLTRESSDNSTPTTTQTTAPAPSSEDSALKGFKID